VCWLLPDKGKHENLKRVSKTLLNWDDEAEDAHPHRKVNKRAIRELYD
jgi:hypothetical protein